MPTIITSFTRMSNPPTFSSVPTRMLLRALTYFSLTSASQKSSRQPRWQVRAYVAPPSTWPQNSGAVSQFRQLISMPWRLTYQLLTGQLPFQGRTQQQIMFQHLTIQPPAPSQHNVRLSPAVDTVL